MSVIKSIDTLQIQYTYNPGNFADGSTVDLSSWGGKLPKFGVADILQVVESMRNRNSLQFRDGNYCGIISPLFLKDLRRDEAFLNVSRYPGHIFIEPVGKNPVLAISEHWVTDSDRAETGKIKTVESIPTGFVFGGVRWFVSPNLPKVQINLNYINAEEPNLEGMQPRTAELGIAFGTESIREWKPLALSHAQLGEFVTAISNQEFSFVDPHYVTAIRSY
jgi:hypothetical protein